MSSSEKQPQEQKTLPLVEMPGATQASGKSLEFCQVFSNGCGVEVPCYLGIPQCAEYWPKPS